MTAVVFSVATMLFAIPTVAQVRETSIDGHAASATDGAMPALTLVEVESALASMEADAGIEDSVKPLPRLTIGTGLGRAGLLSTRNAMSDQAGDGGTTGMILT